MVSPVSEATHDEFKPYNITDAITIYEYIEALRTIAIGGGNVPYHTDTFIKHADANKKSLAILIHAAKRDNTDLVKVPASILFWLYRGRSATGIRCSIVLPHVCKIPTEGKEKFFVTTKQEWQSHRDATTKGGKQLRLSEHAKLNYMIRVLGVDVDTMLDTFPFAEIAKSKGNVLADGRTEHVIGNHVYVMDGSVCVTVLDKSMVTI